MRAVHTEHAMRVVGVVRAIRAMRVVGVVRAVHSVHAMRVVRAAHAASQFYFRFFLISYALSPCF